MKKIMLLAIIFASVFSISVNAQVKDTCPPCPTLMEPVSIPTKPCTTPWPGYWKKEVVRVVTKPSNYSSSISNSFNNTTNNYYGYNPVSGVKCPDCGIYGCSAYHYGHHHQLSDDGDWDPRSMFAGFIFLGLLMMLGYYLFNRYRSNNPYPKSNNSVTDTHTHTHHYPAMPAPMKSETKPEEKYPEPVEPALDLSKVQEKMKGTGDKITIFPDGKIEYQAYKAEEKKDSQ